MLSISTIPEALVVLSERTGRKWSDSELFDFVTKLAIELHAAVPAATETTIQKFEPGEGLVEKHRMPPGHSILSVLFPFQVAQLWVSGETKTSHPDDHAQIEDEPKFLIPPICVTRSDVRIKVESLKKILKSWKDAENGLIPSHRLPEWMKSIPPLQPQQQTNADVQILSQPTAQKTFLYWLAVADDKTIKFAELPHLIAKAIHPTSGDMMYAAARVNLDDELLVAARDGRLKVRNPANLDVLTSEMLAAFGGDLQNRAVVLPHDLRPFLAEKSIELRLVPGGNGPEFWTLENAASAIAEQEGWHNGACGTLLDAMVKAANNGELIVRHPHTDLPINTGEVHTYYELVKPSDVNAWFEKSGVAYRWNVAVPVEQVAQAQVSVLSELPKATLQEFPGKMPTNSVNALAVKAAWEIECNEQRKVTSKEVMSRLQEWAKAGNESNLKGLTTDKRGVVWITSKSKEKNYGIEALQRTLATWNNSRPKA